MNKTSNSTDSKNDRKNAVFTTYMWQEVYGDPIFRFQTNDPAINRRMRQRADFTLALWGLNENLWVYKAQFYSPQKARQSLSRITRQEIKKDPVDDLFYAQTYPIVAPKGRHKPIK